MLKDEELTYKIRGCVYEVYRHLGAGFLESVYQKALIQELELAGLVVQCEVPVVIHYKGEPIAERGRSMDRHSCAFGQTLPFSVRQ